MYLKLIVAIAAIAVLGILGSLFVAFPATVAANEDAEGIMLLPDKLGSSEMLKSWHNDLRGNIVETGALYAAGTMGAVPVMLDFRRGDPRAHNGIGCFLTQGYDLVFERLRKLRTSIGVIIFDVGAVRSGNRVKLIAAAACTPNECRGQRLPFSETLIEKLSWNNFFQNPYLHGVVPVAVILEQEIGPKGLDATLAEMNAQLQRTMLLVDLAPARQLAAAQGG